MRWIIAVLLAVHGLIHFMGFAKAFGYADLPQLTQAVSREMGLAWLAAGLLVVASAVVLVARPRNFWILGAVAFDSGFGTIDSDSSDDFGTGPHLLGCRSRLSNRASPIHRHGSFSCTRTCADCPSRYSTEGTSSTSS